MDLKDQLKNLFPDHDVPEDDAPDDNNNGLWLQDNPLICKYEKRHGKPITIIEGYTGADSDFKQLAKDLKKQLGVGGSFKNEQIIIQGDYRKQIMEILKDKGFNVKRVGG